MGERRAGLLGKQEECVRSDTRPKDTCDPTQGISVGVVNVVDPNDQTTSVRDFGQEFVQSVECILFEFRGGRWSGGQLPRRMDRSEERRVGKGCRWGWRRGA